VLLPSRRHPLAGWDRLAVCIRLTLLPGSCREDSSKGYRLSSYLLLLALAPANKIRTEESPVVYHLTHPFTIRVLNSGLARKSSTSLILTVNSLKYVPWRSSNSLTTAWQVANLSFAGIGMLQDMWLHRSNFLSWTPLGPLTVLLYQLNIN
jgi:hypothetical protein